MTQMDTQQWSSIRQGVYADDDDDDDNGNLILAYCGYCVQLEPSNGWTQFDMQNV